MTDKLIEKAALRMQSFILLTETRSDWDMEAENRQPECLH